VEGVRDDRRGGDGQVGTVPALTTGAAAAATFAVQQQALEAQRRLSGRRGLAWALHDLAKSACARGDLARAGHFLEAGHTAFEAAGVPYGSYRCRTLLGDVHRMQARWGEAAGCYGQALEAQQRWHFTNGGAETLEGLAQVGAALHRPVPAARLFGAGHAWRSTWRLPRQPAAEPEHARVLALAQEQLSAAAWLASYTAGWLLGQDEAVQMARQVAVDLSRAGSPRRGPLLTARQREVVRLLAEGWSNAAIAERLVLSRRTVDAHLRTVYARLGVASRTGAVHEAARLQLI
jgi:non-specific serine/threonine protein kinase